MSCEEKLALMESQRTCAIESERRDATRIMEALASERFCTPEETYGNNSSWAILDLIRAVKEQGSELMKARTETQLAVQRIYLLIGEMGKANDPNIEYFTEREQYQIERLFPQFIDWKFRESVSKQLRSDYFGYRVTCLTCKRTKVPIGRSVPMEYARAMCDDQCPGFRKKPLPSNLFPNESEEDFGYKVAR